MRSEAALSAAQDRHGFIPWIGRSFPYRSRLPREPADRWLRRRGDSYPLAAPVATAFHITASIRRWHAMSDSRGSPGCSPPVAASQSTRHLRLLWVNLEGFILDAPYLASLQRHFPDRQRFRGYGAATLNLAAHEVEWQGRCTYLQRGRHCRRLRRLRQSRRVLCPARLEPLRVQAMAVLACDPAPHERSGPAHPCRTLVMPVTALSA